MNCCSSKRGRRCRGGSCRNKFSCPAYVKNKFEEENNNMLNSKLKQFSVVDLPKEFYFTFLNEVLEGKVYKVSEDQHYVRVAKAPETIEWVEPGEEFHPSYLNVEEIHVPLNKRIQCSDGVLNIGYCEENNAVYISEEKSMF